MKATEFKARLDLWLAGHTGGLPIGDWEECPVCGEDRADRTHELTRFGRDARFFTLICCLSCGAYYLVETDWAKKHDWPKGS